MRLPLSRLFGPGASAIALLAGLVLWMSGVSVPDPQTLFPDAQTPESVAVQPTAGGQVASVAKPHDRIRVASFNMQVFGVTKAANPDLMTVFAHIIRHFDVVAIQEIRSKDPQPMRDLLAYVNSEGPYYNYVISPRLGRTVSKEQYAYIFDTRRVGLVPGSDFVVNDPDDRIHREPHVASFRSLTAGNAETPPFTFTLINIHTDPDEAKEEMDVMYDVFVSVRQYLEGKEDDIIVLGDMNVEPDELGRIAQLSNVATIGSSEPTNTALTRQIDHIIADRYATAEFTGVAGVINYMRDFGFSKELAKEISDHMPVWAEFEATEAVGPPTLAGRPREALTR